MSSRKETHRVAKIFKFLVSTNQQPVWDALQRFRCREACIVTVLNLQQLEICFGIKKCENKKFMVKDEA
jgi:hypothetical protein